MTHPGSMRIGLVSEELAFGRGSGGIGGAFHELAITLADAGHVVEVIYLPLPRALGRLEECRQYYAARRVRVIDVPVSDYVSDAQTCEGRAYAVFRHLRALAVPYDVVHFHDYKGLGYFALAAKQQKLAFADTVLAVQAHGPTRWTLESNGHPFSHEDQLKIDFMERQSIARADILVSPSRYMIGWLQDRGWAMPDPAHVHVIQNVCTDLRRALTGLAKPPARTARFDEIVFFGRHEDRKGIGAFCDALDILAPELDAKGVRITFLGGFGEINGEASAQYLATRSRAWAFAIGVLPDLDRLGAARALVANPRSLIVIASPAENSPYTVLEAAVLGKPLLTSSAGGGRELLDRASAAAMTCEMTGSGLAAKLRQVLARGLRAPPLAVSPADTERQWLAMHERYRPSGPAAMASALPRDRPKVMVAITHHERPQKLCDAILSVAAQTYANIETVVVDDGSRSEATEACLARLRPLLDRLGVRLIRQDNQYLGAARNRAVRETQSDYVLFLDDDDMALPALVQTLVTAAQATGAGIVQCLNLFMEEHRRSEACPFPDDFAQKVSYLPLAGPLSLAPLQNVFGSATALIRREVFEQLGGYSEMFGVGHEDYELYVRAAQAGVRMELCPLPLYLYEVGRPSMMSRTSRMRNFDRVARAIDFAGCGSALADLVSLTAGRRAVEHAENLRAHALKTVPHGDLLGRATAAPPGGAEQAVLLAEYAQALGASSFAAAMLSLARQRSGPRGPGEEAAIQLRCAPALPLAEPVAAADPDLLGATIDLSFGRIAEAVAAFRASIERGRRLGEQDVHFLARLGARGGGAPELFRPALRVLRDLPMTAGQFVQLAPAMLRLALRAGDPALALRVVERGLEMDEARYLAEHRDVARAVATGEFASALMHFEMTGRREGRAGFILSARLCEALHQERGAELPPGGLRAHVAALGAELGGGDAETGLAARPRAQIVALAA